ncbi:unnamed protein product [Thlaspi arvense]|uniref:F-box domain-containing protein n=1 Tax=Thlaspi arvense TaxID=13288 RepID=A0AAU9SPK4_THLAR|nr:unnamed protein product [Thlaspi arvense]
MPRIDWISELPEELLLRILSLLPARDVVATMVLSKRWQFVWMHVPRLVYDDTYQGIEHESFSRFVERSLLLHEAPVLELLHFKLRKSSNVVDIGLWTRSLSRRHVSKLVIEVDSSSCTAPAILPRSLYTACGMLVTLKLNNAVLVDFDSSSFSFPSLKSLSLVSVEYPNQEFVDSLLSRCHVLEDLDVE